MRRGVGVEVDTFLEKGDVYNKRWYCRMQFIVDSPHNPPSDIISKHVRLLLFSKVVL